MKTFVLIVVCFFLLNVLDSAGNEIDAEFKRTWNSFVKDLQKKDFSIMIKYLSTKQISAWDFGKLHVPKDTSEISFHLRRQMFNDDFMKELVNFDISKTQIITKSNISFIDEDKNDVADFIKNGAKVYQVQIMLKLSESKYYLTYYFTKIKSKYLIFGHYQVEYGE